ncbi:MULTISPECIES: DivIVA domain-containing protein [Mogibacterium]|uniref:DivIVA protein n=2 Tax=Mogibacterium timidum TaxID=35519 RepID=X8ISA0_9FIRM|nr:MULTISPECIES: DivIVA domain-containing protein [Mogibacterium]EJU21346.1 DivIVA protein [Mogibacterium sp. CM50]EUC52993.1 DivIVA protein [Mogibacterium timidum ATCC 33093]NWO23404.1 DivIVA domain-containing protein [Mogibacterium timidum]
MIMPIDIDKKDFTRDKKGYNSREVDEFLDLIIVDYEKVLNDNRNMAHKIKFLEKQLEESQKSDTAMLDTLETAKRLMADISASAERRAELMMRDAELEAESMLLEAKTTVKKLNDEHLVLKQKVERLRGNYAAMLKLEMEKLDNDEYGLLPDLDRSDIPDIDKELRTAFGGDDAAVTQDTLVIKKNEDKAEEKADKATVSDLSESLKNLAKEQGTIDDTIILK